MLYVKEFFVTILALVYLASVTGANLHLHYCMGELISWELTEKPLPNKCSKCGMTSKKGCCNVENKFVKGVPDQKIVEADFLIFKAPTIIDNPCYSYSLTYSYNIIKDFPYIHAPPGKSIVPVYISNCVFRI